MFSKATDVSLLSGSNSSSVDWECDGGSRSWSSSASWSDDVEGEATSRLRQQLQDIDSVLYGEASPKILPCALRQEVAQWRATFPHLRVCGTKPPVGPRPEETEEGKEEVYASHGDATEESDVKEDAEQIDIRNQLKCEVMQKLFDKVRTEMVSCVESKSVKGLGIPAVSAAHQREPLLAHRQSARKDNFRKLSNQEDLEGILRVSPLPRKATILKSIAHPKSSIVLPPIEPLKGSFSALPLGVIGRQSRLMTQMPKVNR